MYGTYNKLIYKYLRLKVLLYLYQKYVYIYILKLQKPVNELGKSYVDFMRGNLETLRQKIADELFTLSIFEV